MAEVSSDAVVENPAKDPKQLKKEKKEQERLQKEKEKQEKKLEKEKKKREENERKRLEREAKKKAKEEQKQLLTANGDDADASKNQAPAGSPQSPAAAPSAGETAATALSNGDQLPVSSYGSTSGADRVTVAEPPGQISGCGTPIGIVFDATRAGDGPLTASCSGDKLGAVPAMVTETQPGMYRVQFTPETADVYTLRVLWSGIDVNGSPFTINLSLLPQQASATTETAQPPQRVEEREVEKMVEVNGKEEEEEEVEDFSDDPFDMALQASRLLEEQRKQAAASFNSDSSTSTPPPQPVILQPSVNRSPAAHYSSGPPAAYPSPDKPLPYPEGFPATKEDVSYLEEMNKKLQETNMGLGQEVADLKKKMGEFEAKLSSIEQTSRAAEEERKELMANISLRGWLYKRGIKGPTANVWRHRYFRCDQGNKIYYFKAADDPTPKGNIDLEKVESVDVVEETDAEAVPDRFCFNVKCPDRTYQLYTDSEDTRRQWITAIQYLRNWHQKNRSTLQSLTLPQKD